MSTMSAGNNSIKRRKIDGSASTDACCLTDLPKEALIHVATFLAAPSRALFAASLDGSPSSSDENISAIFPSNHFVGSGGPVNFQEISAQLDQSHVQQILLRIESLDMTDILDFGKIGREYVVQLSDDGIRTVLLCVDAVNTVKRVKLANCISITGVGLEPLRDSTMIEQIDLSLVEKQMSPSIDPEPPISCDAVLPILDSIISQDGCALMHLQFPKKWQRTRGQQFEDFVTRYNQTLRSPDDVRCIKCNETLRWEEEEWIDTYDSQNYTCYECLNYYCYDCCDFGDRRCKQCERRYCQQCERMNRCYFCDEMICVGCDEVKDCSECNQITCSECAIHCSECDKLFCLDGCGRVGEFAYTRCDRCVRSWCYDCSANFCLKCEDEDCYVELCNECNEEAGKNISFCEDCDTLYCGKCRVRSCQEQEKEKEECNQEVCTVCFKLAYRVLVEETKQLKSEVKDLKVQIERMKI